MKKMDHTSLSTPLEGSAFFPAFLCRESMPKCTRVASSSTLIYDIMELGMAEGLRRMSTIKLFKVKFFFVLTTYYVPSVKPVVEKHISYTPRDFTSKGYERTNPAIFPPRGTFSYNIRPSSGSVTYPR